MEEPEKAPDRVNEVSVGEASVTGRNVGEDNKAEALSCPGQTDCVEEQQSNKGGGAQEREGPGIGVSHGGRKKHRRGSKKNKIRKPRYKWKPYHKLTWEEKRKVEERDSIRATRRREEISRRGRPIAPYNTTQFLMDEHDKIEPDLHTPHDTNRLPSEEMSDAQDDCNGSFSSEDEAYFDQDFTEVYETAHVENLNAMSKAELIRNYLDLEKRVETLESNARQATSPRLGNGSLEMRILNTDYVSSPRCVELPQEDTENGLGAAAADDTVNC